MASTSGTGIVSLGVDPFVATAEATQAATIVIATITLPAYGASAALTLRLSTREYTDPDGLPYDPILLEPPAIDHGGNVLETAWQPIDARMTVLDQRTSGQTLTQTFHDYLTSYEFTGARVHIQQAFDNLTSVSQFRTLFDGECAEVVTVDQTKVVFQLIQNRKWVRPCPPRKLTKTDWPNAPSQMFGASLPILMGDWYTGLRYLTHTATTIDTSYAGIARGGFPMTIVDSPTGSGTINFPKFVISDRDVTDVTATSDEWWYYEPTLNRMVGPGLGTFTNPSGGPASMVLLSRQVSGAILPIENRSTSTSAAVNTWQELTREDKDSSLTGYASLDYDAVKRVIELNLPDIQPLGTFVAAWVRIWYAKNSSAVGTAAQFGIKNNEITSQTMTNLPTVASGTFPSTAWQGHSSVAVATNVLRNDGWSDIRNCSLRIDVGNAGQKVDIHRIALVVDYKVAAKVEVPGTQREVNSETRVTVSGRIAGGNNQGYRAPFTKSQTSPDILSFNISVYGYGKGKPDDGAGTYTGTASALIEHPCDVVHYLLREFGGVASGEVAVTSGDFGSFVDARTALSGYKMQALLSEGRDLDDVIQDIGSQTLTWFHRRGTLPSSPFVAIPWDTTTAVNYRSTTDPYTFARLESDVVEGTLKTTRTRLSMIANNVRVNYDWDARTNTYADQLYISDTASRVYVAGAFTTDATRVASALASLGRYGRREIVLSLKYVRDKATAQSILTRFFDLRVEPRVVVKFDTWINAFDLERGHVLSLSSDWDTVLRYPKPGSNGSWASKKLRVYQVTRQADRPTRYAVSAVEV